MSLLIDLTSAVWATSFESAMNLFVGYRLSCLLVHPAMRMPQQSKGAKIF
jgi:hypothetical protein